MSGRIVRRCNAVIGVLFLAAAITLAGTVRAQQAAPASGEDGLVTLSQLADDADPAAQSAPAQTPQAGQVRSPVLTIDTERLFAESLFGQRILAELSDATEALAAENRRIEAELKAEEQSLTERRPTMEISVFRAEADAFDARVQQIRIEQDAKERALQSSLGEGQDTFLAAATPILGQLMLERGAAVILDRRTVLLAVGFVDVTDVAISAINDAIGDGGEAP